MRVSWSYALGVMPIDYNSHLSCRTTRYGDDDDKANGPRTCLFGVYRQYIRKITFVSARDNILSYIAPALV